MAAAGWITVPGKGKRYRMSDGSYRLMNPGDPLSTPVIGDLINYGLQGAVDWLNRNQIGLSAPAKAAAQSAPVGRPAGYTTRETYTQPGVGEFDLRTGRPVAGTQVAPLVTPPQRAQLEESNRMLQQAGGPNISQRLVPTESEADALNARYAGKEYWQTTAGQDMLELAQQQTAPADVKLAEYYEAQRAVGLGAQDEILAGLTQGLDPAKAEAMKTWAKANPMLAYREYDKRFPKPTTGPDDEAIRQAMAKGQYFPSESSPDPLAGGAQLPISYRDLAPSSPGNVVPAPLPRLEPAAFPTPEQAGLPVAPRFTAQEQNLNGTASPLPQVAQAQAVVDLKGEELLRQHLAPLKALRSRP